MVRCLDQFFYPFLGYELLYLLACLRGLTKSKGVAGKNFAGCRKKYLDWRTNSLASASGRIATACFKVTVMKEGQWRNDEGAMDE